MVHIWGETQWSPVEGLQTFPVISNFYPCTWRCFGLITHAGVDCLWSCRDLRSQNNTFMLHLTYLMINSLLTYTTIVWTSFACPRLRREVGNAGKYGTYNIIYIYCDLVRWPVLTREIVFPCWTAGIGRLGCALVGLGRDMGEKGTGGPVAHINVWYVQCKAWHRACSD